MNEADTFLTDEEVRRLTARKLKTKQIESLRRMGIPFFVNAIGRPVVTRVAVIGGNFKSQEFAPAWTPKVLKSR